MLLWIRPSLVGLLFLFTGCDVVAERQTQTSLPEKHQEVETLTEQHFALVKNSMTLVDQLTTAVGGGAYEPGPKKQTVFRLLVKILEELAIPNVRLDKSSGEFSVDAKSGVMGNRRATFGIQVAGISTAAENSVSKFGVRTYQTAPSDLFVFFNRAEGDDDSRIVLDLSEVRRFSATVRDQITEDIGDLHFDGSLEVSIEDARTVVSSQNFSYSNNDFLLGFTELQLKSEPNGHELEELAIVGEVHDKKRPGRKPGKIEITLDHSRNNPIVVKISDMSEFEIPELTTGFGSGL